MRTAGEILGRSTTLAAAFTPAVELRVLTISRREMQHCAQFSVHAVAVGQAVNIDVATTYPPGEAGQSELTAEVQGATSGTVTPGTNFVWSVADMYPGDLHVDITPGVIVPTRVDVFVVGLRKN